ncbi:MAG: hypothetical protein ACOY0S_00440 [Patescibacteria group bacterium]
MPRLRLRLPAKRYVKGAGFIAWQSRHMFYHVLLGLVWAWFLRERWGQFNWRWVATAVVGSLLPDLDHFYYFVGCGRHDSYTRQIKNFLKARQWRAVTIFIANGHKYNTNLSYHNYYFMALLFMFSLVSSLYEWEAGVILFGAMIIHYLFDIGDDIMQLGSINPNWKRWGKPKKR